jgi:hypothetical protein
MNALAQDEGLHALSQDLFFHVSESFFGHFRSRNREVQMTELKPSAIQLQQLGHWVCLELVLGQGFQILFMLYFKSSALCSLLKEKNSSDLETAIDLAKELLNWCTGTLKQEFQNAGLPLTCSYPVCTRAFDTLLYKVDQEFEFMHWQFDDGGHKALLASRLEVVDYELTFEALTKLLHANQALRNASNSGIEML